MFQPSLDQHLVLDGIAGDSRCVARRLALGASPHYMDPIHGSALICAVKQRNAASVSLLLRHGADANAVCPVTGLSALDHALEPHGTRDIVDLCTYDVGTDVQANAQDTKYSETEWPRSFFEMFAMHCDFLCCEWDACDLKEAGVAYAMQYYHLNLDELAFLARAIMESPSTDFHPMPYPDRNIRMTTLLETIQDLQVKKP